MSELPAMKERKKIISNEILLPEAARLIGEGRTVTIKVRGNSMNPFLVDVRDKITLGRFTSEELMPGAVVLARDTTGRILFHRIIHRSGDALVLQGDGNIAQTEESSVSLVMGLMIEAIRKDKKYPADGKVWKLYSYGWLKLTPVRRWLLAIFRRL